MQRQLLQIADKIPDDIMLTLLKCFAKISSLEPEPAKIPFIRAFTKRQDSPFVSSESEAENECTFNLKLNPSSQEVSLGIGSNENQDDDQTINQQQNVTDEENAAASQTPPVDSTEEAPLSDAIENVDEGIDVEIPKVSSDDEATAEEQFDELNDEQENKNEVESEEIYEYEESLPEIDDEPIPEEPPKVSLDDIERELQQMQAFLSNKGLDKDKKRLLEEEEELRRQRELAEKAKEEEIAHQQKLKELNDIEDAYVFDVCVKLKNRDEKEKYRLSENYREEVINEGPIFDPNVPNTIEDFMRAKTYNGNKKKIFDMSWQNLCENQKKVYK